MGDESAKGGQIGSNPFIQSSLGLQGAYGALNSAYGASGATAGLPTGYTPTSRNTPDTIFSGMSTYMNPFTDQVIGNTTRRINENLETNLRGIGANAHNVGAFGGSRHGVLEGQAIGDAAEAVGDISAQLEAANFGQAAALSGQDVANDMSVDFANASAADTAAQFGVNVGLNQGNQEFSNMMQLSQLLAQLSGQSLDTGRTIAADQAGQGQIVRDLNGQIINAGNDQFNQIVGSPSAILQSRLQSLGLSPLNNASTQTTQTNPGAGTILGNLLGAAGNVVSFSPIKLT